jgi:hypothetical protein
MSYLARREFLKFIGVTTATASFPTIGEARIPELFFTPVRIPSPLPVYTVAESWLRGHRRRNRAS